MQGSSEKLGETTKNMFEATKMLTRFNFNLCSMIIVTFKI